MRSYQRFVNEQCRRNPSLSNLCGFLASPDRYPSHIACLRLFPESDTLQEKNLTADALRNELSPLSEHKHRPKDSPIEADEKDFRQYSPDTHPREAGRILIIDDLTTEVVEILGLNLDIDPLFFASHIHASQKTLKSQTPELANLPSRYRHVNYMSLHYHRAVVLRGIHRSPSKVLRLCNITRRLAILPPLKGIQVGLAQHCCSILKTVDRNEQWLSVILVDPPLSDFYETPASGFATGKEVHVPSELFLGGYEDFLHPPNPSETARAGSGPQRLSLLEDLLHYWRTEPPPSFEARDPGLLSLAYYPLRIVAAEWMNYITILDHSIKEYEYGTKSPPDFLREVERLNLNMAALQTWRRRILGSRQKLQAVVRYIATSSSSSSSSPSVSSEKLEESKEHGPSKKKREKEEKEVSTSLTQDYEHILSSLRDYSVLMENMLPVLTSFAQLVDSRRSYAETANISRLTILALIFVPLSFLASLFSMNPGYGPGGDQFWVYFVVAVPVTLAVFVAARPPTREWRRLVEFVRRGKRGGGADV